MIVENVPATKSGRLPRAERRKQLLAAAQSVFIEHGYHNAAMDDIAAQAGVSKPVLYQHFPGKLELYLALIDEQAATLIGAIAHALSETNDNRQRVHGVLTTFFDFVDGSQQSLPGGFRLIFETDLGNESAVRERVDKVTTAVMQAVADTVSEDTGLDRPRAELLAMALTGGAQVVARWWINNGCPVPKAEAVALVESLQWRGISNFPRYVLEQST